jgi:hypothetical protein
MPRRLDRMAAKIPARMAIWMISTGICIGCSSAHRNSYPVVTPPPARITFPDIPKPTIPADPTGSPWTVSSTRGWLHLRRHAANSTDIFEHDGRIYLLATAPLSYAKGTVAPYLVLLPPSSRGQMQGVAERARRTNEPSQPPLGAAVIDLSHPDRIDLTFESSGVVKTLADIHGPRAIDLYEHDCLGCTMELDKLVELEHSLSKASGQLVVVTSEAVDGVRQDFRSAGSVAPVVPDNHHSIYAVFLVHRLPVIYIESPSGKIIDDNLGNLRGEDVARLENELGIKPAR